MTATTPKRYASNGWQNVATGADEFEVVADTLVEYAYGATAPTLPGRYPLIQPGEKHVANLPASRSMFVRPLNSLPPGGDYWVAVTSSAM